MQMKTLQHIKPQMNPQKQCKQKQTQNNHKPDCQAQRLTITDKGNAVEERAKCEQLKNPTNNSKTMKPRYGGKCVYFIFECFLT